VLTNENFIIFNALRVTCSPMRIAVLHGRRIFFGGGIELQPPAPAPTAPAPNLMFNIHGGLNK
jgi:hypothetical protein